MWHSNLANSLLRVQALRTGETTPRLRGSMNRELLVLFPVNCEITFLFLVKRDFGSRKAVLWL